MQRKRAYHGGTSAPYTGRGICSIMPEVLEVSGIIEQMPLPVCVAQTPLPVYVSSPVGAQHRRAGCD